MNKNLKMTLILVMGILVGAALVIGGLVANNAVNKRMQSAYAFGYQQGSIDAGNAIYNDIVADNKLVLTTPQQIVTLSVTDVVDRNATTSMDTISEE